MKLHFPSLFNSADLTIVDVGARGGLPWQWQPFQHRTTAVLVEPDPTEAADLVRRLVDKGLHSVKVIDKGLGASDGEAELNLLRNPECSSILEPNHKWLARFPDADRFRTTRKVPIRLGTLDNELSRLDVKRCDFLKLDVQGYESEVLDGATRSVAQAVAIEAEISFNTIYCKQPLFAEIDSRMKEIGLQLIDLERIWWRRANVPARISTRGQIIWANVLYIRDPWFSGDWSRETLIRLGMILCAYRMFDIVHELFATGVLKGSLTELELSEVDDWMSAQSFIQSPFWRWIGALPSFPFRRRVGRFFGMMSRCLHQNQYGEGVGVDAAHWDRKWEWL